MVKGKVFANLRHLHIWVRAVDVSLIEKVFGRNDLICLVISMAYENSILCVSFGEALIKLVKCFPDLETFGLFFDCRGANQDLFALQWVTELISSIKIKPLKCIQFVRVLDENLSVKLGSVNENLQLINFATYNNIPVLNEMISK